MADTPCDTTLKHSLRSVRWVVVSFLDGDFHWAADQSVLHA
jgi:hypothetical protein